MKRNNRNNSLLPKQGGLPGLFSSPKRGRLGKFLLTLCLLLASMGAWAADYVFVYNGNYLGVNAAGTDIQNYTTFNPERCVWTCMYNGNESTLDGTSRALRITYNGNTRYLNGSTTAGAAPTLSNTAQNVWRADGTRVLYRSGYTSYYLYYRGSSWRTSSTGRANNNTGYQSNNGNTDYRATLTAITYTNQTAGGTLDKPTVSYSSLNGTSGIQLAHTNVTGTSVPAHSTFVVGGTTYYRYNNQYYTSTNAFGTTIAANTVSYTWSVTSSNASISTAGVVTPNNGNTSNITVRVTANHTNPTISQASDNYTITVSSTAAATTYTGGLNAVTPANSTLTYNANTGITLDSPARKKNATPAYQTYTASGNTFYRVNNNFQAAAPTTTTTDVALNSYSWTLTSGAGNAQLASATGTTNTLTYNTASQTDVTATVSVTANYAEGGSITKTANVSLSKVGKCTTPTITLGSNAKVTITAGPGETIYYKTDDSYNDNGTYAVYTGALDVTDHTRIWAYSTRSGNLDSDVTNITVADAYNVVPATYEGINLQVDGVYNLTYTLNGPTNGEVIYNRVVYASADPTIATVNQSGRITAIKAGTTKVTLTGYKLDGTALTPVEVNVTVRNPYNDPTSMAVNSTNQTLNQGETWQIVATAYGTEPVYQKFKYEVTGAGGIVSVSESGLVKALSQGNTVVTVSAYNYGDVLSTLTQTINITVIKPTSIDGKTCIYALSEIPNNSNGRFILMDDITVTGNTSITGFTGTLDGNFKTIGGLTQPLFETINNATVYNVIVDDVNISRNGDAGAIACQAAGASRIYNCGVLATNGTSTVTCTRNGSSAGSIVGYLNNSSRVINCYSYANVSAVSNAGGIVGYIQTAATQGNINTANMVMNCMFYGDITGGTAKAPVFGGATFTNAGNTALNGFNYYRYESPYSLNGNITIYNSALAAEERYLTRFEFYRNLLNSNRELAAWYATGSVNDAYNKMAKWVLDKSIAPYPILKPQGIYPSIINFDAANAPITTERNKGGKLGTLSVSISQGTGAPTGANITTGSLTLNITDKDEDNFNFNYYKVQLPYYNEVGTGNYTRNKVVTGWEITISGGKNAFGTANYDAPNYNFADRNSTGKDNYATSGRIFAQGGYFNVPEGVTSISIKPHWADCVYLSDPNYDLVYTTAYAATNVTTMGGRYTNGQNYTINGSSQTVYTTVANAVNALQARTSVYDAAIVLVGNVHDYHGGANGSNTHLNSTTKSFTVMSADLNFDNEPDYSYMYQHTDRQYCAPIRFDFLNWPGVGMAQKVTGTTRMPNQGIFYPRGWFEITNTCIVRFTEFEYDNNNKTNAPLILMGGIYEQFTSTQSGNPTHTTYIHLGDNVWFKEFENGTHADGNNGTPHRPISVTGGEYEKFYLSGTFKPSATVIADNAECYINGGKFGEVAGAGQEQINGNVTWLVDHADIREFYGGGINAAKPVTGNITVTMDNSYVEQYCGGPKFGNMSANKTVTTTATGSTFGKYFGAGYGGTSFNRYRADNQSGAADYAWNTWADGYYERAYNAGRSGIATNYEYEYFAYAGGGSNNNVGRFYVNYASFSLARTNDVSSTLNNCTVLQDYYGGGSLGMVNGNATSELNGCTVYGNAFGGGFSATIPSLEVMNKAGFNPLPSYNGNVGVYNQGGYPTTVTYTWSSKGSTANPFTSDSEGNWIYTNVDLTSLGQVTGNTTITVTGDTYIQGLIDDQPNGGVFGGGDASEVKGTTTVNIASTNVGSIANVYGGANKANVGNNTVVNVTSGTVGNVFGANNVSGTKAGTVAVNINQAADHTVLVTENVYGGGNQADYTGNPLVNMQAGTVNGSVFGGGLSALVTGNTDVEVTGGQVNDAVYGGGALANVTGNTVVNLEGGTVHDVYGGGLGRLADDEHSIEAVAALVGGNTNVTLDGSIVTGQIFGANNLNGTPQGTTKVLVKTTSRPDQGTGEYDVKAVYGGGNLAAYIPSDANLATAVSEVYVVGCDNSIEYVYGGGNAAPSPATLVTIEGGDIYYVFGGGNGAGDGNPGADVGYLDFTYDDAHAYGKGTALTNIYGGIINTVFGGSNTKGNIRVSATVNLDDRETCTFNVGEVYGAGNEAEMYGGGNLIIGCIPGLNQIFGGAKKADVYGDVSLTITNGTFGKVYGGNNLGGCLRGGITVNIEETGCTPVVIGELYGGGYNAAYSVYGYDAEGKPIEKLEDMADQNNKYHDPVVNVRSFTNIGTVYGGGEGAGAVVYGNPIVNIEQVKGKFAGKTVENVAIPDALGGIGTIFGGGNAANVVGNTTVNIATVSTTTFVSSDKDDAGWTATKDVQGAYIDAITFSIGTDEYVGTGNVYGGGNQADVTGKTNVIVGPDQQ